MAERTYLPTAWRPGATLLILVVAALGSGSEGRAEWTAPADPPGIGSLPRPAGQAETGSVVFLAPFEARSDFAAGVDALHDFWLGEAGDRFRRVQEIAPDFTLGYWGEALSLHDNPFGHTRPPVDEMRAVLARLASDPSARLAMAATDQERGYLAALEILVRDGDAAELHPAYAEALGRHAAAFPGDVEAQAFHARALLLVEPVWGRAREIWPRVEAICQAILERDFTHHGALHYLIHALDTPVDAARGLDAAGRYADIAEGASHAVHMPSHIYMQLGRWDDVVASNRDALATSRRFVERTGRSAAALDAHAVEFLVYSLLQQGRHAEARELIAEFDGHRDELDAPVLRYFTARWHHLYLLHAGEAPGGPDAAPFRSGYGTGHELLAAGLHALATGRPGDAAAVLAQLEEQAAADDDPVAGLNAGELRAAVAAHEGRHAEAVEILRDVIPLQERMPRPNEIPDPVKPPEELLGEVLLEAGRLDEADAAFRAGEARWPGRLHTLLGLARIAAQRRDDEAGTRRYRRLLDQLEQADPAHPMAAEARAYLGGPGRRDPVRSSASLATTGRTSPRLPGPRAGRTATRRGERR